MDDQFKRALVTWIRNGTGINTVFRAQQNGPCPWPNPYVTFQVISEPIHLHADEVKEPGEVEGDIKVTHLAHSMPTVSINVYAENGWELIDNLWNSKRTYEGRLPLVQINAALLSFSGPRDLTGLQDTEWKPRFQGDFTFNYRTLLVEANKVVERLTITGKMENDDTGITGWDDLS